MAASAASDNEVKKKKLYCAAAVDFINCLEILKSCSSENDMTVRSTAIDSTKKGMDDAECGSYAFTASLALISVCLAVAANFKNF